MKLGDWVVLPSKMKPAIHFAEIKGDYVYDSEAEDPYYHYRKVKWFALDIPRSNFDQDLLYSFGAFLTICRISRNDAEIRIREMANNAWKVKEKAGSQNSTEPSESITDAVDMEQLATDQIARFITRKYKGHGMARLVEAILKRKDIRLIEVLRDLIRELIFLPLLVL